MTGKERITRILRGEPVDRVALHEHFWIDTQKEWTQQGHLRPGENMADHFGFDLDECWAFNMIADLDFEPQVVAETAETITFLDGNGATLKRHKLHDSTPEHVAFRVCDRETWEEVRPLLLEPDRRRIDFAAYRRVKEECRRAGRFFVWSGINVFECMHPLCGHENLLAGMALDPDWVLDMASVYANLTVELQKILFEEEGYPDGIWYYEDMGYKGSPFMSPRMYCDLLQPAHKYTIGYAHEHGLPVIMHSCGFVEPLLPHMIESGIDCLQALEVKAGMDLVKLYTQYSGKIAFMGGVDVRALYSNDRDQIDRELLRTIPYVKDGYRYILHSDHSIPKTVDYESFLYFIEKALELGTY